MTDTTASPTANYVEQIRGVDVLVHECNYPDGHEEDAKVQGHSTVTAVCEVARQAEVGRLILTHIDPTITSPDPFDLCVARRIFPQVEMGVDGMVVEF